MAKNYIFKIPYYLSGFSLCESGKILEYDSSNIPAHFTSEDTLWGFVLDEQPSFKYEFSVISANGSTLKLNKVLEASPGFIPHPENKLISKCLEKSENIFIEITQDVADTIRRNMVLSDREREELSKATAEERDFLNYITAIRTKPFLLLAGISGTGKSRIVRQLAKSVWPLDSEERKAQKPSNFEMIQVKPNWHDSSELLGYVSRIGDTPEFIAGDFLKFIVRAWAHKDIPYFLCLDEMNLAPVEQYFAEFLSVMESRKLLEDGRNVKTDALLNNPLPGVDEATGHPVGPEWYEKMVDELLDVAECPSEEVHALRYDFLTEGISIPQNLIVVGTVNMDETTYAFSRKVLDRAMTIEMNEVDLKGGLKKIDTVMPHIAPNHFLADAVEGYDVYENYQDQCDIVINYLEKVNGILEGTPFKIAYRTRNEFLIYVVNALKLNKPKDPEAEKETIAKALDEVTSMKILSRIEGDKRKVEQVLKDLRTTVKLGLDEVSEGYSSKDTKDQVSLPKLKSMSDRLETGYTSFWD